jgi:hypothetical protein
VLGRLLAQDLATLAWSSSKISQVSPCAHAFGAQPTRSPRATRQWWCGSRRGHDGLGAAVSLGETRGEGSGRTGQGEEVVELTT